MVVGNAVISCTGLPVSGAVVVLLGLAMGRAILALRAGAVWAVVALGTSGC